MVREGGRDGRDNGPVLRGGRATGVLNSRVPIQHGPRFCIGKGVMNRGGVNSTGRDGVEFMNQNEISRASVMHKCVLSPPELVGISAMGDAGIFQTGAVRKGMGDKELGRCGGGKGGAREETHQRSPSLALRVSGLLPSRALRAGAWERVLAEP